MRAAPSPARSATRRGCSRSPTTARSSSTRSATWIPAIQPKFLKALEEKRFRRLGEVNERRVDVRLIAATNQDLAQLVHEKRFRSDLYFRINTLLLRVPPLRERREDVPPLAAALLRRLAVDMKRGELALSAAAEAALARHSWPGNVRELRNVLERAILACDGPSIEPRHLRFEGVIEATVDDGEAAHLTLEQLERRHIVRVLHDEGGHVIRTAERLGIPRSTLYQKIKTYGLDPTEYRGSDPPSARSLRGPEAPLVAPRPEPRSPRFQAADSGLQISDGRPQPEASGPTQTLSFQQLEDLLPGGTSLAL